jgi:hypothetical protein
VDLQTDCLYAKARLLFASCHMHIAYPYGSMPERDLAAHHPNTHWRPPIPANRASFYAPETRPKQTQTRTILPRKK